MKMKKSVLLTITSAFLLASCQSGEVLESGASIEPEVSNSEILSSSEIASSSDPDDGLDDIFLTLEDNLKPFVKGDKNGFKIKPVGEDPLFKLSFKTDGEISLNDDAGSSEEAPAIKEYDIELNCEESTIETFNRTKKRGYCNRMTFENADISIIKDGRSLINLTQTYVGYLAQTAIAGTNPTEYENGLYLDLSRATLSRVTFAPLFNKLLLPAKNYLGMDTLFEGLENLFPMSTTMNTILPSAIDLLKEEVRSGALELDIDKTKPIEEYKIHREIESKEALRSEIDEIVDAAFSSADLEITRADVDGVIDSAFDMLGAIRGNFEINFNEEEFKNVILDFSIELNEIAPEDMADLGFYFNLDEFVVSGEVTLMDPSEIDYSTYPTDLQNRSVWKDLSL